MTCSPHCFLPWCGVRCHAGAARFAASNIQPAANALGHSLTLCVCVAVFRFQAGCIAAEEGAAGLVLHARHADQQYSPPCHWGAVADLVAAVPSSVPVIGNGDVFEAADAIQMMRQTGCRGEWLHTTWQGHSGGNTLTKKTPCLVLTESFKDKAGFVCRWSGVTLTGCGNPCCAVLFAYLRCVVAVVLDLQV